VGTIFLEQGALSLVMWVDQRRHEGCRHACKPCMCGTCLGSFLCAVPRGHPLAQDVLKQAAVYTCPQWHILEAVQGVLLVPSRRLSL